MTHLVELHHHPVRADDEGHAADRASVVVGAQHLDPRADVTLTDVRGRTAYIFSAYEYDPGWRPYAATAG